MISIDLKALKDEVERLDDVRLLEDCRIKYLGKQGLINKEFQSFAKLAIDEKKTLGAQLNDIKLEVSNLIEDRIKFLEDQILAQRIKSETIDVTLPAREKQFGGLHPISCVADEIANIFANMGFEVEEGPDIDSEYNNFTALNFPQNHPAKEMHDTFYVEKTEHANHMLLRTHTSTVQIRKMERSKPPFKFMSLGKVYRRDYDATHTPMFHQVEGVYIDKNVNMAHMKTCLYEFIKSFFANKSNVNIRFRPSFFPFVEPGGELDIWFEDSNRWLELLGCGMVHPKVLKGVGIDSEAYQGFAFGLGIERCAMLKYGIDDCRAFYEGDIRWLKHHGFKFFRSMGLL